MLKKTMRSVLALILVFTMLVGTANAAFAAASYEAKIEELIEKLQSSNNGEKRPLAGEINYASLGDSMTNGYGLDGYNANCGVEDYGDGSYANKFAEWLGNRDNVTAVNHAQLAMSALRAEDLHWLLEVDYEDAAVISALNTLEATGWNESTWNSVFTTGDYWTWSELVHNYRFDVAAAYIEDVQDVDCIKNGTDMTKADKDQIYALYTDAEAVAVVAEYYQTSVEASDILTLAIGNGNFGVFMFGRVMEAVGFGGEVSDVMIYDVEDAIRECPAKLQGQIKTLMTEVEKVLAEQGIVEDDGDDTTVSAMEAVYNIFMYSVISYALNYAGTLEAILALNPNAEIIEVALMNTFESDVSVSGEATLGDVMNALVLPLNAYIAGLPAYMQGTGNSVYEDAKFYYAAAESVECIVDTYFSSLNSIVRDRFFKSIVVNDNGELGLVWEMLSGVSFPGGINVTSDFSLADVDTYTGMSDEEKAALAAENASLVVSIAVYLAFEDAIVKIGGNTTVALASVLGLGDLVADPEGLFSGVIGAMNEGLEAGAASKKEAVYGIIAYAVESGIENKMNEMLADEGVDATADMAAVTAEEIKAVVDEVPGAANVIARKAVDALVAAVKDIFVDELGDAIVEGIDGFISAINAAVKKETGVEIGLSLAGYYEFVYGIAWTGSFEQEKELISMFRDDAADADGYCQGYLASYVQEALLAEFSEYELNIVGLSGSYIVENAYNKAASDLDKLADAANEYFSAGNSAEVVEDYLNDIMGKNVEEYIAGEVASLIDNDTSDQLAKLLVLDTALSDALCGDETVKGLLALFARCMIGDGIGSHPSADGHESLYNSIVDAYVNDYTAEDETIKNAVYAAGALFYVIAEYYDEAYAYAYEAALKAGKIDAAVASIDKAIKSLTSISLDGYEMTDAFKAELEGEIAKAVEALEAAKALVLEADVIDAATISAVNNALAKANDAVKNIKNLITQAGRDVADLAIIPTIKATAEFIETVTVPEMVALVEEFAANATDFLTGKAGDVYPAFVGAIALTLKDYAPETVAFIIYYLNNNADSIVAFFTEYAPVLDDFFGDYDEKIDAEIKALCEAFCERVNTEIYNAMHADYYKKLDSIYTAIGDETVFAYDGYADRLAAELGFNSESYVNLGTEGLTVDTALELVEANKAVLADSDIITVGFGNGAFTRDALKQIDNALAGIPAAEYDWSALLGAKEAAFVDAAIAEIKTQLTTIADAATVDMIMAAVESLAYNYLAHCKNYPVLLDAIREASPEALVIVVGMYNGFENIIVDVNGVDVNIGEYAQYLVGAANAQSLGDAIISENTIYVHAPEVETNKEASGVVVDYDVVALVWELLVSDPAGVLPSENGHEYIKTQIYDALNVIIDHKHEYEAVVTEPTCTEGGYTTYTCKACGYSYIGDETDALGHDYEAVVTEPDCTNGGYTTYTCKVCGYSYIGDETDALGHDYEAVVTEPTCDTVGYTTYTCSRCEDSYVGKYVAPCGHDYDKVEVVHTCTTGGYTIYTCNVCDYTYVGDSKAALGHDYDIVVTAPTCTDIGYTTYTCKVCDNSYISNATEPTGHDYNIVVTAPTCTDIGYTTYTCKVCDYSYVGNKTVALGHDYKVTEVIEATCTETGKVTYTCVCGDSFVEEIPANCPSEMFTDVDTQEWYHEAVDFVIDNGLMNGIGGNKFSPAGKVTRSMVVTVLYRLEGSPAVSGNAAFTDVKNDSWYTDAVIWATNNGITNGVDNNMFAPEKEITREEIVVLFYRYLEFKGVDVSETIDLGKYNDASEVSSWAITEMKWAVKVGFIQGRTESLLAPGATVQRSELATLLMRFCNTFNK